MPVRVEPASQAQRTLWLLDRYRGGNGMMGVPLLYRLRGTLDRHALIRAVEGLCQRHEALRTTFGLRGRTLQQFVHPPGARPVAVQATDLSGTPAAEEEAGRQLREFLRRDPDPASSPLDVRVWRLGPAEHVLAVNVHHLITDAWSSMLLARDLAVLYSAAVTEATGGAMRHHTPALPPVDWQLADYTCWQHQRLSKSAAVTHQEYWREQLRGAVYPSIPGASAADSPGGNPVRHSPPPGTPTVHEWLGLPPDLVAALRTAARSGHHSLLSLLLTAVMSALRQLTGQQDLAIGTVLANRDNPRVRQTVGLFADMTVVRARCPSRVGPGTLVSEVHRSVRAARMHADLPFLMAPRPGGPDAPDDLGRPEDVVFHMLPVPPDAGFEAIRFAGLTAEPLPVPDGLGSRFDLEVLIVPTPHGLDGLVRYAQGRCPPSFARRLATACATAAEDLAIADHPSHTHHMKEWRSR